MFCAFETVHWWCLVVCPLLLNVTDVCWNVTQKMKKVVKTDIGTHNLEQITINVFDFWRKKFLLYFQACIFAYY